MTIRDEFEKAYRKKYNDSHPWLKTYRNIQRRCNLPKTNRNYKYYRGVVNFLTPSDLKSLWERDKAHLLKQPSIDRIDPKGHYTFENCRYIELKQNSDQGRANRKRIVYGATKICIKCFKRKPIDSFRFKHKSRLPNLRHNTCISCKSHYDKKINPRSLRRVN